MKWKKKGAVFAVAIAVMLLMATTMVLSSTEPHAEKVKLTPSEPQAEKVKLMPSEPITFPSERRATELKWTFMVYLDGDNNLEGAAIDDFLEMSSVSSTADINIVVQFDRIPGYSSAYGDWTTTKRFLVTPGMTPTPANAIEDIGECNMGDPNTLSTFVTWTMTHYPADNYALMLWNHGSGWREKGWVPWNDNTGIDRGICWDDTNGGDYLTLQETEQALAGKSLSLLGYDACLMHMIEVVYQVAGSAGISVGSEETEPWDGWPYNTILSDLTGTPTMTPTTLGTTIVQRYIESYGTGGDETQSAVDNGDVSGLVTAVDNFAQVLISKLDEPIPCDYYKIQQARNEVEEFYYPYYIDLYHFAELIGSYVPGTSTVAQAVRSNINNAVYAEAHGSGHPYVHGLSIYFPKSGYLSSYGGTAFAIETQWDEFLKKYYEGPEPCCAKAAVCMAGVLNPDEILDPMRALRDDDLKEEDVDRYYDYSTELTMAMTKDPALADEAARLLVKYSPMIEQQVTGTGKVKLITQSDVAEVVSFTDGLKRSVSKNRGEVGATRSQEIIKYLDVFKGQVEASEGKTFSEALQDSIYYKGNIDTTPDENNESGIASIDTTVKVPEASSSSGITRP